jgi:hypothetical protein
MDQLEEAHYYTIARGRVDVLTKLEAITPASREKTIQTHIFNHLWLLDPSWERASVDERMEVEVGKEWKKIDAKLSREEKKARLDIKYRTAAGKHIVIELKRYSVAVSTAKLYDQLAKYVNALEKVVKKAYPDETPSIEAIAILGSDPTPRADQAREALKAIHGRYILYDQLIRQTRESYRDYLDASKEISRIREIIGRL